MEPSPHPAKPENAVGDVSPARRERKGAVENTPSEAHRLIWQSRSCRESGNVEGISLRTGKWRGVGKRQARGLAGVRAARAGEMPGARRPQCRDGGAAPPKPGLPPTPTPTPGPSSGLGPSPPRASHPRQLPQAASPPRRRLLPEQKLCVSNGNRAARQLPPPPPPPAPISASPVPPAGRGLGAYQGSSTPLLPH